MKKNVPFDFLMSFMSLFFLVECNVLHLKSIEIITFRKKVTLLPVYLTQHIKHSRHIL